ncbi:hypothetical protein GCM10008171_33820 [Methylopila jiangsuensis]|uniref:Uncharacterized protein n=1 Tax=Methylopila jiangsuensis TaxID=586230 RepID=A0A9W6JMC5_9HYPH|nr:Wadjet anti-phage system protein JetA family protein [Methylopila jiangsuensis]MDR6284484.1 hypothetical protein [Methylopila jiangsuensis]GLK78128.1 hypothetical protein GCM10008171_33820 [Methylopila jiangsuensis]
MSEHFLARAKVDIFRPFTGRHRAIFFEIVVELYERTLGVAADYDLVLDKAALTDIIVGELVRNRDLVFVHEDDDPDLDSPWDDKDYADKVRKRLKDFGMIEDFTDSGQLKVLWRFTPEGKRIAKMFSDTRRKTAAARQRSVRACKAALRAFVEEGNHEFLVDAYEYASTIFDDVCQVSDLFAEHQRRIMANDFPDSRAALEGYMEGVRDFDRRAKRYFNGDNIFNHASDLIDLVEQVEAMAPQLLGKLDKRIAEDHPALEESADGEPIHAWMLDRIRRVVLATRDIKHSELHRQVGEFNTKYAILINSLMKMSDNDGDDPLIRFAVVYGDSDEETREFLAREMLRALIPLRADLVDPDQIRIAERAERSVVPTKIKRRKVTREERLAVAVRDALTEAFAVPTAEVIRRVKVAAAATGETSLISLPVVTAHDVLSALSAPEIVRSVGPTSGLIIKESRARRSNGVFEAPDHKIVERA